MIICFIAHSYSPFSRQVPVPVFIAQPADGTTRYQYPGKKKLANLPKSWHWSLCVESAGGLWSGWPAGRAVSERASGRPRSNVQHPTMTCCELIFFLKMVQQCANFAVKCHTELRSEQLSKCANRRSEIHRRTGVRYSAAPPPDRNGQQKGKIFIILTWGLTKHLSEFKTLWPLTVISVP